MDTLANNFALALSAKDEIIEQKNRENEELKQLVAQLKRDNNEVYVQNERLKREADAERRAKRGLQTRFDVGDGVDQREVIIAGDFVDDFGHDYEPDDDLVRRRSRRKRRPKRTPLDMHYVLSDALVGADTKPVVDVIRIPGKRGRPRIRREPAIDERTIADESLTATNTTAAGEQVIGIAELIVGEYASDPNAVTDEIGVDGEDDDEDDDQSVDRKGKIIISGVKGASGQLSSAAAVAAAAAGRLRKFPHHCDWPGCERSFRRPAFLRKHKRVHTGEKPFKCTFDGCEFASADIFCLRTHQMRHTGEKPFKCKVAGCGWSGRQQTSYDRHRRVIHGNQRTFHCDWPGCDRKYRDKHSLNYHRKSHTGEKEFMCSFAGCGKRFIGRSDMKKHESTHNAVKPYKCSWPGCGRSFVQKRYLALHNLKHTGERPFPCDWPGCEWRSFTPHEQAKHKKTHTGERPYPCERCERRFADESNLKAHQRTVHEGQKNHVCDYAGCGKKYTVRRTLLIHRLKAHPVIGATVVAIVSQSD